MCPSGSMINIPSKAPAPCFVSEAFWDRPPELCMGLVQGRGVRWGGALREQMQQSSNASKMGVARRADCSGLKKHFKTGSEMLKVEPGWSCRGFCVSFWKGEFTLKKWIACDRIKLHVCAKNDNVTRLDCFIYHLSFGETKGANYSPSVLRQVNSAIQVCSVKQGVISFPLIKTVTSQFKLQSAILTLFKSQISS